MKKLFIISVAAVLLISLAGIPCPVSAQTPLLSEVWVDDGFTSSTPGWGTTHFATIQEGIDAVTASGTVNVAAGTYNENIIITDRPVIKLLGAGAEVTTIIGDGTDSVVTGSNMNSGALIEGFTITGGQAADPTYGGGLFLPNAAMTIARCKITGNSASHGGGIYMSDEVGTGLSPSVVNCLVKNNSASMWGSGIFFYGSGLSATVMNCTIADNTAGDGVGVYNYLASVTITNSIIYGNSANNIFNNAAGGTSTATYSCIGLTSGVFPGDGNINADPKFFGSGDYHLQLSSPCIDTGTDAGAPANDLDGVSRPQGEAYDMGAFEYQFMVNYTLDLTIVGSGTVDLDPAGPTYPSGTEVTLTPSPASGWSFAGWSGDVPDTDNKIIMDGDKSVTATFTQNQYTLDLTIVGSGTVDLDPAGPTYPSGTEVTLSATPDDGWSFDGWSDGLSGSDNPASIIMDGDKSVTAYFNELPPVENAYDIKSDAISKLEDAKGEDRFSNRRIDRIIWFIRASLNSHLWEDNEARLDARHGNRVFNWEMAAAASLQMQIRLFERQIPALERMIAWKESRGRPTDREEASLAAIQAALPVFEEVLSDLAEADRVLAEVAIEDAQNTPVQNPRFQGFYNKYIARAESSLDRATQLLDSRPERAILYFERAWQYAQKAIRFASRS